MVVNPPASTGSGSAICAAVRVRVNGIRPVTQSS
jgi:hypothetical protein